MLKTFIEKEKTTQVIFHKSKIIDGNKYEIDNEFFEAYNFDGDQPIVDIEKAKEIQLNKFRDKRIKKFEKLDVDFMRALETNDSVKIAEIILKKQMLRDVTEILMPNDIESIKLICPDILN